MAKYKIIHACGHAEEHAIGGAIAGRDAQAARLAGRICGDCYRAQQQAAADAKAAHLPPLEGSEKQIAWAKDLRARAIDELNALRKIIEPFIEKGDPSVPRALEAIDAALSNASAKFWIDGRGQKFDRAWMAKQLSK